jgi:hypothetical protein
LLAKPRHHLVELGAVEVDQRMLADQILGALDRVAMLSGQMHGAAAAQQRRVGSRPARIEHRLGSDAQLAPR